MKRPCEEESDGSDRWGDITPLDVTQAYPVEVGGSQPTQNNEVDGDTEPGDAGERIVPICEVCRDAVANLQFEDVCDVCLVCMRKMCGSCGIDNERGLLCPDCVAVYDPAQQDFAADQPDDVAEQPQPHEPPVQQEAEHTVGRLRRDFGSHPTLMLLTAVGGDGPPVEVGIATDAYLYEEDDGTYQMLDDELLQKLTNDPTPGTWYRKTRGGKRHKYHVDPEKMRCTNDQSKKNNPPPSQTPLCDYNYYYSQL